MTAPTRPVSRAEETRRCRRRPGGRMFTEKQVAEVLDVGIQLGQMSPPDGFGKAVSAAGLTDRQLSAMLVRAYEQGLLDGRAER